MTSRWRRSIKYRESVKDPTICIDFDGVLHLYSKGWQEGVVYDDPIEGAQDACWDLMEQGFYLVVLTARTEWEPVYEWLERWGFPPMEVTNVKIPADVYLDDRAVRFTDWQDAKIRMDLALSRGKGVDVH